MVTLISRSPEETLAIGEQWGREAQSGWIIGLSGDLGAGKTQLVKGIAIGLGSPVRVHSPTFTLINEYRGGRLTLYHLDLYRLHNRADVNGAGLDEYLLQPNGVSVVEWFERWNDSNSQGKPNGPRRLALIEALSETERRITYEDSGA